MDKKLKVRLILSSIFYFIVLLGLGLMRLDVLKQSQDAEKALGLVFYMMIFFPIFTLALAVIMIAGFIISLTGLIRSCKLIEKCETENIPVNKKQKAIFIVLTCLPSVIIGLFYLLFYILI